MCHAGERSKVGEAHELSKDLIRVFSVEHRLRDQVHSTDHQGTTCEVTFPMATSITADVLTR
jgi:hypothetical protein